MNNRFRPLLILLAACFPAASLYAGVIGVIIDDLGYSQYQARSALKLPQGVTFAIIPDSPAAQSLASQAKLSGHEIMLHLPMQSVSESTTEPPGTLHLHMLETEFKTTLRRQLSAFPDAIGVNNHRGSLLTQHPGHMRWLMESLAENGNLYFVDSRTTKFTVAANVAREMSIPHTSRNVFLDNDPQDEDQINAKVDELAKLARREGFALAIGHPHHTTLRILKHRLPQLQAAGYQLVPVSKYIQLQQESPKWQLSSSRSPRAAKN